MPETRVSRRHVMKGAGLAGAVGLAALAPRVATAKADSSDDAIVGAWKGTVSPNGGPQFGALSVFAPGGTVLSSSSTDLQSGQLSTPSYGAWVRKDDGKYAVNFWFFTFDNQTNPAGSGHVKASVTVDGDKLHGTFTVKILDPHGTVVFSGDGTIEATRIEAD